MKNNKLPSLATVIAGFCWGIIGIFVRNMSQVGFKSMDLSFIRAFITTIFLFTFMFFKSKEKLKVKIKDTPVFMGMGIISFVFFNYCYLKTITLTTLSTAAILLYTSPIFVTVMSFFLFNEKFTKNKIIALFLSFFGCCLVSGIGAEGQIKLPVLILGLCSGIGYALYSIFGRFALKKYSSLTSTAYAFLFATIGMIFFTDFNNIIHILSAQPIYIFISILLGIITAVIPYSLYTWALAYVETSKAAIMVSVEPVVAAMVGFLIFKESPTLLGFVGICSVMFALILLNINFNKKD